MPLFIPLLIWGSVAFTAGTAANSIDNATGGHGKQWASDTVTGWINGEPPPAANPQTPLSQNFSAQNNAFDNSAVTPQPQPDTSPEGLTSQANRASAPEAEQQGGGLFDMLGNLMGDHSGKAGIGAGLASVFGLSKMGLGGGKATLLGGLLALAVTYHEEILGFAKNAFNTAKDMAGPTNQIAYSPGFVSRDSAGAVVDPSASTTRNSFSALQPA